MSDLGTLAVAAVPTLAAAVGAIVAVEQLLLPTRLRRQSVWARDAAETELDPDRKVVLKQLELRSTARLVGAAYVPARRFLGVLAVTPLVVFGVGAAAHLAPWSSSALVLSVSGALVLAGFNGGAIWTYRARRRAARSFSQGGSVAATLSQSEGVDLPEGSLVRAYVDGAWMAVAVVVLAFGFGRGLGTDWTWGAFALVYGGGAALAIVIKRLRAGNADSDP